MMNLAHNLLSEIKILEANLLTHLDEYNFFFELGLYLKRQIKADLLSVNIIYEHTNCKTIIKNDLTIKETSVIPAQGIDSYILRTKKAYFSNNVSSDPLFASEDRSKVKASLCMPVSVEGVIIAIMNFQNLGDNYFSREEITQIHLVLNELTKPISNIKMYLQAKQLNELLLKQIEVKEKEIENQKNGLLALPQNRIEDKDFIGISETASRLRNVADKLACVDSNCIIQGEPGVGKELLARRIHCKGQRKNECFMIIDCSSLNEREMEIELFGEELVGVSVKKGALEIAKNGTLLIKNINYMPDKIQSKLYQALNSKKAQKIGSDQFYVINTRIVATALVNMQEEVDNNQFREDLFYCVGKIVVVMSPLRDHMDDIEVLANYFLNAGQAVNEQKILSPGAISMLKSYNWPGNVRELRSMMERAYIVSDGMVVEKNHLMDKLNTKTEIVVEKEQVVEDRYMEMTLEELEQKHIVKTLEVLCGNKTKTAKVLGITVKTLYNKLHNYGLIEEKDMV